MTQRKAERLLACVILARSTSYLFTKIGMREMDIFNLLGIRFSLAFIFVLIIFGRRLTACRLSTVLRGALMGGSFFAVMAAELAGLRTTSTSTTSFLENTAVIFVPLFEAFLRRKFPDLRVVLNAVVALAGIALLTLREALSLTLGESFCILAAMLYALSIILTDRFSKREDPMLLGILEVGFMGLLGLIASFVFEAPRLPSGGAEWGVIFVLALVCTGFGFTLQPVAQRYTTSERAGLYCALNPLFALVLGELFLSEHIGFRGVVGSILILSALVFSRISLDSLKNILHAGRI